MQDGLHALAEPARGANHLVRHRKGPVLQEQGRGIRPAGGGTVGRPHVVLGGNDDRPVPHGSQRRPGDGGDGRGVQVHDVGMQGPDQLSQPGGPAGIGHPHPAADEVGRHARLLQFADEVPLPGQEVGHVDGPLAPGSGAGEGDDQPFGAAGSQPFDDVKDSGAGRATRAHQRSMPGARSGCIRHDFTAAPVEHGVRLRATRLSARTAPTRSAQEGLSQWCVALAGVTHSSIVHSERRPSSWGRDFRRADDPEPSHGVGTR